MSTPVLLQTVSDGVIVPVHAQPGARRSGVVGVHDGRLKVAVVERPEKGKANRALIEVLARELGIRRSQVTLMTGDTASRKQFLIRGTDGPTLEKRIAALLSGEGGS